VSMLEVQSVASGWAAEGSQKHDPDHERKCGNGKRRDPIA
jgi:hypothetical protein